MLILLAVLCAPVAAELRSPSVSAQLTPPMPQRIVSINQCADELLLNLADRAQIKSVSHYVKDPNTSWDAPLAAGIPPNRGRIEEVLSFDPDLVLVGDFNARSTVNLLTELGLSVVELAHPRTLAEAIAQIYRVAELVGHPQRAPALVSALEQSLAVPGNESLVSAVVYQPNGFTTGRNSVIDDVMRAAGLRNVAADWGAGAYSYFPMERLLWQAPQLLILDPQTHTSPSLAHQVLDHPALRAYFSQAHTVTMPPQAWACSTHHLAEAVQRLRNAATELRVSR